MTEKWEIMTSQGGKVTFGCIVGYILGSLRWILLIAFSLFVAALCIFRIPVETMKTANTYDTGSIEIAAFLFLLSILYIIVLGISLLFRVLRPVLGESAKQKLAFLSFFYTSKNYTLIKFIRKISFWGFVVLLILVGSKKSNISDLTDLSKVPTNFKDYFEGYLSWSAVMLAVSTVLSLLYDIVYLPREGIGVYSIPVVFIKDIVGSFKNTFLLITKWVPDKNEKNSIWSLIKFIIRKVCFIVYVVLVIYGVNCVIR